MCDETSQTRGVILDDVEEITRWYLIKDGASNPKPIGNGWRSPGSYMYQWGTFWFSTKTNTMIWMISKSKLQLLIHLNLIQNWCLRLNIHTHQDWFFFLSNTSTFKPSQTNSSSATLKFSSKWGLKAFNSENSTEAIHIIFYNLKNKEKTSRWLNLQERTRSTVVHSGRMATKSSSELLLDVIWRWKLFTLVFRRGFVLNALWNSFSGTLRWQKKTGNGNCQTDKRSRAKEKKIKDHGKN